MALILTSIMTHSSLSSTIRWCLSTSWSLISGRSSSCWWVCLCQLMIFLIIGWYWCSCFGCCFWRWCGIATVRPTFIKLVFFCLNPRLVRGCVGIHLLSIYSGWLAVDSSRVRCLFCWVYFLIFCWGSWLYQVRIAVRWVLVGGIVGRWWLIVCWFFLGWFVG